MSFRRIHLIVVAALLAAAAALGWYGNRPRPSVATASEMAAAMRWFDSTIVATQDMRPVGSNGDALTVGLGYVERLRLGLGSPFRLADEALHDPRLDSTMARRVAWTLLGRLDRGDAYVIDSAALAGTGPWSPTGRGATGAAHIALVERTIRGAATPRAGELTVRLGYAIAAGGGAVGLFGAASADEAAALIKDLVLAKTDERRLLNDARRVRQDPLVLLAERRADHGFIVEQPSMASMTDAERTAALAAVPQFVAELDTLDRAAPSPIRTSPPVLGVHFAARLRTLGAALPPVAQVAVTLGARHDASLADRTEEMLAADAASYASRADSARRPASLAVLSTAVALRALAQETPWFPGDPGPSAADVQSEFSLGEVSFSRAVPATWRPYYLSKLESALTDFSSALPNASFDGLRVHIGDELLPDSALAMHDPRSRTLRLSIGTSGGTLAHEIAHDLDWQASRRLYAGANGYSTDRAMHERGGELAASVHRLAEARTQRGVVAGPAAPPVDRPAELFARGADWFVATTLARQGRSDGFLSAIQDATLPGYAAGAPAAVGLAGASSVVSAIRQMTALPDSTAEGFAERWSDPMQLDPVLLVRRVFQLPIPWRIDTRVTRFFPAELCTFGRSGEGRALGDVVALAIDVRARAVAARRSPYHSIVALPDPRLTDAVRAALASEVGTALADQGVLPVAPPSFRSSDAICSAISR